MSARFLAHLSSVFVVATFVVALLLATVSTASAKDYFLTIGGGYAPSGNQVSLEKNVIFFQKLLEETHPDGAAHDIYFADGQNPARDLQFHDPDTMPKLNTYMARLFNQTKELGFNYRSHKLTGVRGMSSRDTIQRWFEEEGAKLTADDRLLVYVTAHGGSSGDKKKDPYNTKLYLWNTQNILVKEFVKHLDKVAPEVSVVMVMVQCYSGGYANIIFEEGDEKKPAVAANRCGFFATVHDRVAAGCTPDIDEENYHEYSSYFWAALRGKTRTGKSIDVPDYDGDGHVSFEEAHAYSLIQSTTIDISIKTSDRFLRAKSKQKGKGHPDLLSVDSNYDDLLAMARPSEREVLEQLSQDLELSGENRADAARKLTKKLNDDKKKIDANRKKIGGEFNAARGKIQKSLVVKWPELINHWNPSAMEYLLREGAQIQQFIEKHGEFSNFQTKYAQIQKMSSDKRDLDRKLARCQRLIRTLENIALAANLAKVSDEATVARYEQLLAAEAATLRELATAESAVNDDGATE